MALVAALPVAAARAQSVAAAQVAAAAVATFKQRFPAAKSVKWEKEGADYEAGFTPGRAEMSAVLTAAGVLRETETEIAVAQLPAPVQKVLAARYKAAKVTEAGKI